MIVDSSALISMIRREVDAQFFAQALGAEFNLKMSAATFLEVNIVLGIKNPSSIIALEQLIAQLPIEIVPFTEEQAQIARTAYRNFGKGSGHKAQFNFGDCFSYALAKAEREPLLCKGNDFCHADLKVICP
ncbi:MAG: putative pilT protein N-terminal putative toxin of TAS system [Hyphomonadaceae bacterium]|nr:MAG: putative pilT protein N-terminal putative toxin of TAS system [Hyphomonadaceae bacterium]KAF0186916.1 MAG: putative pilT protein N-terminal putative toxin of TAS system [Hyphomonadaceae bacterium]